MRLADLCRGWLAVPAHLKQLEITGVSCDSRHVEAGNLFVAVNGETRDGHSYLSQAIDAGAAAVVGEKPRSYRQCRDLPVPYLRVRNVRWAMGQLGAAFHGFPSRALDVVGVTGTKGKTTTTWLLHHILGASGHVAGLFGTVENHVGSRVFPATNTTPGCLDLHCWFNELLLQGGSHAVVEVSSHALRQQRTAGIEFDCAVFTNIAPEHLDYHKTFERYLAEKIKLFSGLPASAAAVLPREEKASTLIAARTHARIVWYSGDVQDGVEDLRMTPEGMQFLWKGSPVRTRLWGAHNLANALAAMTAAECLGLEPAAIAGAMASASPPPGRLEQVAHDSAFRVVVDYAHTDNALAAVLKALRPLTPGRLITIFGCGGDRDRDKRPRMGRVAEENADQLIITSDNPRGEPPARILSEIVAGLERPDAAVLVEDRREAIGLGIRMARRGDTVLIAGKGHETYQQFKDHVVQFDDREVAREFLNEALTPTGAEP